MNLLKFKFGYEKYGLTGFINILLSKIGFKYRIQSELKRMIIWRKSMRKMHIKNITNTLMLKKSVHTCFQSVI